MLRDEAILLERKRASGEWLSLLFLTPRYGKVRITSRRSRLRERSPWLDPLRRGELLFHPTGERKPGGLVSFVAEQTWPKVRRSFEGLLTALHFCCLAGYMAGEGEGADDLYDLLNAMLDHLGGGGDPGSLRVIFELRLLELSGYGCRLDGCCCGSATPDGEISLSALHGGRVCRNCREGRGGPVFVLPPGALSVMRTSLSLPLAKADRLRVLPSLQQAVLPVAAEMISRAAERELPSAALLDRVSMCAQS